MTTASSLAQNNAATGVATKILLHMEIPNEKGLYVLGSLERRVTLYSQQVRALNLVYALASTGLLSRDTRVAVIGGGAAGLTFAAAAASVGSAVTLLEQQDSLLSLQRGNHTRWIHPHIYDWPSQNSLQDEASLPLLSWRAGIAGEVADQILQQWNHLQGAFNVQVHLRVSDILLAKQGKIHTVTWNSPGYVAEDFDVVVLAVGFGLESSVHGINTPSYWRDDGWHQTLLRTPGGSPAAILVSGCGDGGLTDLLRVSIRDFRHDRTLVDLVQQPGMEAVREQLLGFESNIASAEPQWLTRHYQELPVPVHVRDAIKARRREDTRPLLNGTSIFPITNGASILNRFLVTQLVSDSVSYIPGAILEVSQEASQHVVTLDTGKRVPCDALIIRHGTHSPLQSHFSNLWDKCQLLKQRNVLDETRTPLWPSGFFEINDCPTEESGISIWPSAFSQSVNSSLVEDVLFDVFTPKCLPYYIRRPEDESLSEAMSQFGVWVFGPSGTGKTTMIRRILAANQALNVHEISLANAPADDIVAVLGELYLQLLDVFSKPMDLYRATFTAGPLLHSIVSLLGEGCKDGQHAIYIDEIPVDESALKGAFTRHLAGLMIHLRRRSPEAQVKFVLSSIFGPGPHLLSSQQQVRERLTFVPLSPWTSPDLLRLATSIREWLRLPLNTQELNAIVSASNGSPRFIKLCFRKLLRISASVDRSQVFSATLRDCASQLGIGLER